ncbi:MAG: bifunctional glutamate N-acetyltransferase/amino-acid acetyltransferase ArgJ [Turneriella sp.]|nr:bifunctional glutamate N-acetyltransferase/amino-acid acetyltransferase ArgJ [Turneriella sp.]
MKNDTITAAFKSKKLNGVPRGYRTFITNAGIKDNTLDLGIVLSDMPATAAAVFTKNQVKGNPVLVGMKHIRGGRVSAVVVNSKNSNVATGKQGYADCIAICKTVAAEAGLLTERVFPSSTGVIGRRIPVEKILAAVKGFHRRTTSPADFEGFAKAIMTTDTFPKFVSRKIGKATLVGVAKGSGMIEPNMATMLSYFFTDADIPAPVLRKVLKTSVDSTFNSLSVDTDTSTSDTVLAMANGLAGKVPEKAFAKAFGEVALELTRMLARDGEGATKLFKVTVKDCASEKHAKAIGKSIINSPLVKTAIYKGDPNWGRIFMAVGKTPKVKIYPERIKIRWGGKSYSNEQLPALSKYLKENEELHLEISLGTGKRAWTVYGCDYTEDYVKINAYYTT